MLDKDMREPLFDFLDDWYGKIRVLEEKTILSSRADALGVIDGAIIGFELKSDHDTYQRLATQVRDYERVCDLCYAVVGQSHAKHVGEHIPDYWGIIVINSEDTVMLREAKPNPNLRMQDQMGLMWRRELDALLEQNQLPKYKGRSKAYVQERILSKLERETLKKQMTDLIFERDYTIFEEERKKDALTGQSQPVRYRKTKSGVKARRKKTGTRKKSKVSAGDSLKKEIQRAHVTHYIAGRRQSKKKK